MYSRKDMERMVINARVLGVNIEYDPLNKLKKTPGIKEELFESNVAIFGWCTNSVLHEGHFMDLLDLYYPFGIHESKGSKVDRDGIRSYPDDPDQYPLFTINIFPKGEKVFIYNYGVISIVSIHHKTFTTRVD